MASVAMPPLIHIGTRKAFQHGQHYIYCWDPTHLFFICDRTTADGLPGEHLVILIEGSSTSPWYVAVEGVLTAAGFVSRRAAFRTQEEFWSADWHDWQVNRNNGGGEPDWSTRDNWELSAETVS